MGHTTFGRSEWLKDLLLLAIQNVVIVDVDGACNLLGRIHHAGDIAATIVNGACRSRAHEADLGRKQKRVSGKHGATYVFAFADHGDLGIGGHRIVAVGVGRGDVLEQMSALTGIAVSHRNSMSCQHRDQGERCVL